MKLRLALFLLLPAFSLTACNSLPSWMGYKKTEAKLSGERISILKPSASFEADSSLQSTTVEVPAVEENTDWAQHSGNPQAAPVHASLSASLSKHDSANAGDGNDFKIRLIESPIVAGGVVYAMDAIGMVSAHDVKEISNIRWISPGAATDEKEPILGGGLAYADAYVYAASGKGLVVALDAASGTEIWRQALNIPVRSAPRVEGGHVYIVTVDSQLFALDAKSGSIVWSHRGINEGAGFLIEASASVSNDIVIAPYSSGEVYALRADTGEVIWSDTLLSTQRQSATGLFTGIGGDPVVVGDTLYVAGSAAQLAAFQLTTGRRLWEQPISSVNTPAVVGDYLAVLTTDAQLVLLNRQDGRIRWIAQLAQYENPDEHKGPYTWSGPVLAGGRLLVVGAHGELTAFAVNDGSVISQDEIPSGSTTAPVVANNALYLVTDNATLHAFY